VIFYKQAEALILGGIKLEDMVILLKYIASLTVSWILAMWYFGGFISDDAPCCNFVQFRTSAIHHYTALNTYDLGSIRSLQFLSIPRMSSLIILTTTFNCYNFRSLRTSLM
jgi:hypothetical protein